MKKDYPPVWECEHNFMVNAAPDVIWRLFEDVSCWKQWNVAIEHVEINGPFEVGALLVTTPTGQEPRISRLLEVRANAGFLHETRVGELRIFVDHRLEPADGERTRVVFSLEAFGAACDTVGPAISHEFPEVLKSLAARAEALPCEAA